MFVIGRVHPLVQKDSVYVLEFSLTKLIDKKIKPIKYKESSKFPDIKKDLAFVVDKKINSIEIENVIKKAGGKLLVDIEVFDVYTGEKVKDNKKSIAYNLTFRDNNKTLTDEEVMEVFNNIIKNVEGKLDAKLRDK